MLPVVFGSYGCDPLLGPGSIAGGPPCGNNRAGINGTPPPPPHWGWYNWETARIKEYISEYWVRSCIRSMLGWSSIQMDHSHSLTYSPTAAKNLLLKAKAGIWRETGYVYKSESIREKSKVININVTVVYMVLVVLGLNDFDAATSITRAIGGGWGGG